MLRKRFFALALVVTLITSTCTGFAAGATESYVENSDFEVSLSASDSSASNPDKGQGSDKKDITGEFPSANISWTLTNAGMLTLRGEGVMDSFDADSTPWSEYDVKIKFIYISEGITSIGDYVFYGLGDVKTVYIPDSVTAIGASAFEKCDKLQDITLPDTLTTIGDSAFRYCSQFKSVGIPASVTSIGKNAFSNCEKLRNIYVSSDSNNYCDIDGVLFTAGATNLICYPDEKNNKEYKLPDSVTAIGAYAFDDCDMLTSVILPEGLISIGDSAFYGCSQIEIFEIPASVTDIAQGAFTYGCDSLKEINVDEANNVYSSENGVLFNKDKTKIIRYPAMNVAACEDGTYVMPKSITVIGKEAFLDCQTAELLWIHGSLQKIEMAAFMNYECLTKILFDGTIYNWEMVEKDIYNEKLDEIPFEFAPEKLKKEFQAKVGVTYYLKDFVDLKDNEAIIESLVVSSSNTDVAIVDKEKMTAISEGEATITAIVNDAGITIAPAVKVIVTQDGGNSNTGSFDLIEGETMDLKNALSVPDEFLETLVWNSSNKSVATVDNGVVTAVDDGTAVVIATVNKEGSLKYNIRCTITVTPKYTDEKYFTINNGGTITGYTGPDAVVDIPPTIAGVVVTGIGERAFLRKDYVTKVELPQTVTTIGNYAFYGCSSLSNISLHNGITGIGNYAFAECDSLIKMTIPSTVNSNGMYWFYGSDKLSSVAFANGTKVIGKGMCNSAIKSVTIPSTVVTITDSAFSECTSLATVKIPDSVTSLGSYAFNKCKKLQDVTLGSGIETIEASAFVRCEMLSEIVIPNNVVGINANAFRECTNLKNVTFGDSLDYIGSYAFYCCTSLENVVLPETLTTIYEYAFSNTGLTSIVIPNNVSDMGENAFSECHNLSGVVFGNSLSRINKSAFAYTAVNNIVIPDNITTIEASAFNNCDSLTDVKLNRVNSIGRNAFYYCKNLNNIELPDTLERIEGYAFGYTGLTSAIIPDSVSYMGNSVFYGCSALTDVTIGSGLRTISRALFNGCNSIRNIVISPGVKTINDSAFAGCTTLTSIVLPDTITVIEDDAFYNCYALSSIKLSSNLERIGHSAFYGCRSLEEITIPDTVKTIGEYAFYNCNKLKSMDMPDSVTSVGQYAFSYCYALEQVKLSNNLKSIPFDTFYKCTSLKEIVIPDTVTHIYSYSFAYCSELSSVTLGANISYFGSNVFYGCNNLSFSGGIPASVAKYILSNNLFETGDLNIIYKYFNEENTSYAPRNEDMVGYFEMELKYDLKDDYYYSYNKSIKVNLPQSAYLMPGTMMLDGELLGEGAYVETENAQYGYNYVTIPVTKESGVLTFCIKPTEYTKITTYAEMTMYANSRSVTEFIGYSNCSLPEITMSAPDITGKPEFIVEGITLPDCEIRFYGEGIADTKTTSSRTGAYRASLTLENPENYREYVINAQVTHWVTDQIDGAMRYYAETAVQYVSNTPSLEGLDMYYGKNGYTKTKYDLFNATSRPKIRWGDYMTGRGRGYSYYFAVDVTNRENVDSVYVVSIRNNKKSYLEAVWNEYTQRYETSGYFDNNCEYIPGVLTIEYVKGDAETRLGLSDIATYLDYESDAFAPSVTEYTGSFYSAVVSVGEALQEIFGSEIDFAVETIDRDYTEVTDEELYEDKFNYYAYPYETSDGNRYVLAFDMSDIGKTVVYLHDITNAKQTTYTMSFVYYDEEGMANHIDVAQVLSRINEYSGKLLNVYDINIDTDKLVDDLLISELSQEEIDTGIIIADNLNMKKQLFVLMSTMLSATAIDGISAPVDVIDCLVASINKDVSYFKQYRMVNVYRIGSESKIRWMIDPSGYVYEAVTDNRLEGVTATAYCIEESKIPTDTDGNKDFASINPEDVVVWDATEHDQINPLITDAAGEYKWDVPDGYYWQVKYEKEGYETTYSEWLPVPPVQTNVNIGLVSKTAPKVENVNLTTDYMVLTFDKYIKPETLKNVKIGDAEYTMEYDNTKSDLDGNVFAKEFTFKFTETLPTGTDYTVSVADAESYAGEVMEAYSQVSRTPGEPLPKELMLTSVVPDVNKKSISLAYHNNTTTDMTVNIVCVIYDASGDIAQIEMLGSEGIKVGEKIDRVFGFDSTWAQYKIYTWYSSSLKPAAALYDSAKLQ